MSQPNLQREFSLLNTAQPSPPHIPDPPDFPTEDNNPNAIAIVPISEPQNLSTPLEVVNLVKSDDAKGGEWHMQSVGDDEATDTASPAPASPTRPARTSGEDAYEVTKRTGSLASMRMQRALSISLETKRAARRVQRQKALLVLRLFVLILLYCGFGSLIMWLNYFVGYNKGKWGFSFLVNFLGAPGFTGLCWVLGVLIIPKKAQVFNILYGLALLVVSATVTWPIAVTAGRMRVAEELSTTQAPTTVRMSCWNGTQMDTKNWNNVTEFVQWADTDFFVDTSKMAASKVGKGASAFVWCAAPIGIKKTSSVAKTCSIPNAYAICFEKRKTQGVCGEASQHQCGWDTPGNVLYSRVLFRKRAFYAAELKMEKKKIYEALNKSVAQFPLTDQLRIGEPQPIYWFADDPPFFEEKAVALWDSIYIQFIAYACAWGCVILACTIYIWYEMSDEIFSSGDADLDCC